MAEDTDYLDDLQGRWQTSDQDFVVIEADQVWFLGDSQLYGHIEAEKQKDGRIVITFSPKTEGEESVSGGFVDVEMTSIIWGDGDVWKKMLPGDAQSISVDRQQSISVASATGKTIGRLNSGLSFELDEEGQERRWTKNGQLGSQSISNQSIAEE
ncbi:unnamed protein product [Amoebophrya sp. A25]|nr:unnamed protein product [Amoebophrya sp. A25]|eukprot:GSA25T00017010001.1